MTGPVNAAARLGDAIERLIETLIGPIVIEPTTLIRWHRDGFRLFARLKSHARNSAP